MRTRSLNNVNEKAIFEIAHFAFSDWLARTYDYVGQPIDVKRLEQIDRKASQSHFVSLTIFKVLSKFNYETDNEHKNNMLKQTLIQIMEDFVRRELKLSDQVKVKQNEVGERNFLRINENI